MDGWSRCTYQVETWLQRPLKGGGKRSLTAAWHWIVAFLLSHCLPGAHDYSQAVEKAQNRQNCLFSLSLRRNTAVPSCLGRIKSCAAYLWRRTRPFCFGAPHRPSLQDSFYWRLLMRSTTIKGHRGGEGGCPAWPGPTVPVWSSPLWKTIRPSITGCSVPLQLGSFIP